MTTPQPGPVTRPVHDAPPTATGPASDNEGDISGVGCRFDPAATRAWLSSTRPDAGADAAATVAQVLHIDDEFDLSGFHKWTRINNLLAAAQDDGVFGVPGHTIGVLHLADDRGIVDQHRITLDTPHFGVLCSVGFDTVALLTDSLSGVEAAVHLLAHTAKATDTLLYQRAQLAQVDWPTPIVVPAPSTPRPAPVHGPARAFRPLGLAEQTTAAQTPLPDNATVAPRRRR